jgi:predicted nucleic acid binding AN1-type Zn finger protein
MAPFNDVKTGTSMEQVYPVEQADTVETLRLRIAQLEVENAAMRPIVLRMAEARMCRDPNTLIESCPHCALQRGGPHGYTGTHDAKCVVSLARALGF